MTDCKSVGLNAESAEKVARLIGGECKASDAGVGVVRECETGEVGLLAASSLSEGDSGSRFESSGLDMDFRRFG